MNFTCIKSESFHIIPNKTVWTWNNSLHLNIVWRQRYWISESVRWDCVFGRSKWRSHSPSKQLLFSNHSNKPTIIVVVSGGRRDRGLFTASSTIIIPPISVSWMEMKEESNAYLLTLLAGQEQHRMASGRLSNEKILCNLWYSLRMMRLYRKRIEKI